MKKREGVCERHVFGLALPASSKEELFPARFLFEPSTDQVIQDSEEVMSSNVHEMDGPCLELTFPRRVGVWISGAHTFILYPLPISFYLWSLLLRNRLHMCMGFPDSYYVCPLSNLALSNILGNLELAMSSFEQI